MSQTQQTYSLRKEIGFGVELAMSALGEPHQIQVEDQGGAYDFSVITATDPLASLRAEAAWTTLSVTPGVLTAVPAGVRKLAVQITAINNPDAPQLQVFHLPGFFRGTESARYYGVDTLLLPVPDVPPPFGPDAPFLANLELHYDFTDLSTLWQDEAASVRAMANGDPIARIDDKGTRGLNLLSSGGTTPLQLEVGTELWSHTDASVQGLLSALLATNLPPPQTCFCVYNHAALQTLQIMCSVQSTLHMQFRQQTAGNRTQMLMSNSGGFPTNNFPDAVDTWYAAIGMARSPTGQDARYSIDGNVTLGGPQTSTTWTTAHRVTIAANANPIGNNPYFGRIAEFGIYGIGDAEEATIFDDIEAYITAKYGIVWA